MPVKNRTVRASGSGKARSVESMDVMGECVCPKCGMTMTCKTGALCSQLICPVCNVAMVRK